MDYSKTHYYKYNAPATPRQANSTIPVFEADDMTGTNNEMPPANTGRDMTPSTDVDNTPAIPGEGPLGLPTPSLPSTPNVPFPPSGGGSTSTPSRPNTGNIFWSFSWLNPIFGNTSVSSVAQARFYNVNAMLEPVDIYINGQLVVSDLDYSEYTDYLYIIPGYYNVTIYRRTNPGYPFISTRVNFVRNSVCTVSLIGTVDSPGLQFIC